MILVIDYDMGNPSSIVNMIKKAGGDAVISRRPEDIAAADKLILPGVGAFDTGMRRLTDFGLVPLLTEKALVHGVPFLGICLGMQLLTNRSEEGVLPGLGWIDAMTQRLRPSPSGESGRPLKVPHMGWNVVLPTDGSSLFAGFEDLPRFYFVHSYHCVCSNPADIASTTLYGHEFISSIAHRNVYGTQFHPEKSHRFGLQLIRNFIALS